MMQPRSAPEIRLQGVWPEPVVLRQGWSRAVARPWNEESSAGALRLERGNSRFLRSCADWLIDREMDEIFSPALFPRFDRVWREAGFVCTARLRLFESDLKTAAKTPDLEVGQIKPDWADLALIDRAAFPPRWYLGRLGLAESFAATPRAGVLAVHQLGVPVGFSIVGLATGLAYLQRLAVDPKHQGGGIGRSLVRASVGWAAARGARTMLLNTQTDNDPAAGLYAAEGFVEVLEGLEVMGYRAEHES
jgi:ribosomal protein S18 acetylase RimI-like enzyme